MKKIILSLIMLVGVCSLGLSQCEEDDCNPLLTGASFDETCVNEGGTNTFSFDWAVDSPDFICSAPAGSWKIIISLPQTGEYGVSDISTTTGPGFDWTYDDAFKTITGVTNEATGIDFINGADQSAGQINIITDALMENTCTIVGTNVNIAITPAGEPGSCGEAFNNSDGDDSDQSTYGVDEILPVELLSFHAERQGENALLTWVTATEINNDYFEIQVSRDGKSFTPIGSVKGQGTTYEEHYYEFLHQNPFQGINYYRLKQVDIDKSFSYSKIRTVVFDKISQELELNIYPNPAMDLISLNSNFDVQDYKVVIIDQHGSLVRKISFSNGIRINIRDLSPGMYTVKLIDELGYEVKQERIVKVN